MVQQEDRITQLSGKRYDASQLYDSDEESRISPELSQEERRAIDRFEAIATSVQKYLEEKFTVTFNDTTVPKFTFTEDEKTAIHPLTGDVFIPRSALTNLQKIETAVVHECLHYYADRWFDTRESEKQVIHGRKIGCSIRYMLEDRAVDGFGIFDEVLTVRLTKELCEANELYWSKDTDSYLFESEVIQKLITQKLPVAVRLWNTEGEVTEKKLPSVDEVLDVLEQAAWKQKSHVTPEHRNIGRVFLALFADTNIHATALALRTQDPGEPKEVYEARILKLLDKSAISGT